MSGSSVNQKEDTETNKSFRDLLLYNKVCGYFWRGILTNDFMEIGTGWFGRNLLNLECLRQLNITVYPRSDPH
jgi:hypothetical protein